MRNSLLMLLIAISFTNCRQKMEINDQIESRNKIVIGQVDSIYSEVLNEYRKIWIYIPESAKTKPANELGYPVLYLLDAKNHFHSVAGMIKQLSTNGNTTLPEMVVIAILNTNRERDLTPTHVDIDFFSGDSIKYESGGGDVFLDFIDQELIPYAETKYPITNYRTFIGHSFGGLSVIHALISKPHLFKNYVAIDPSLWWDNHAFLNHANSIMRLQNFKGKQLYIGVANTMRTGMSISSVETDTTKSTAHIRSILKFIHSIETTKCNGLIFDWNYYVNDNHSSIAFITEYDALRFLFSWYSIYGLDDFFYTELNKTPKELGEFIKSHYKNVSEQFGYEVKPPIQFLNLIANAFVSINMLEKAEVALNLNVNYYPDNPEVYKNICNFYLTQYDSNNALEKYSRVLENLKDSKSIEKLKLDFIKE